MWCLPIRAAVVAASAALAAAASSPAAAQVAQTDAVGRWSVLEGTANDGSRVCAVASEGPAPEHRRLAIKFFPDARRLEVHISKDAWSIPRGTPVPVEIEFEGARGAWTTAGATGEGRMVAVPIEPRRAGHFLLEFGRALGGTVRFGGTEAAWTIDLAGSDAAVGGMLECIRRARAGGEGGGEGRPTQPFAEGHAPPAPAAPAQPFAPSRAGDERPAAPPAAPPAFVATGRERRT